MHDTGCDFCQWEQHETAFGHQRMGDDQPVVGQYQVVVKQQVDVDDAVAVSSVYRLMEPSQTAFDVLCER